MLSWVTGSRDARSGNDPYGADNVNPPETPAPVFAVKAFKHAIFGTPQTVLNDEKRSLARSLSKSRGQGKDITRGNRSTRSQAATDGNHGYVDDDDDDIGNRNYANDNDISFPRRPLSPTKPNGILMTPGTGPVRRKTVSFGAHAPVTEQGLAARPSLATNKSDITRGIPGKSPSPWTPKVTSDILSLPSSAGLQGDTVDGRDFQAATTPSTNLLKSKSKDDGDITLDMEVPRSESGRYWQARYMSYTEKSGHEMSKLLQKQQAAKQYAKKKDMEAMELITKLNDERRRHRLRERALESQLKEHKEQLGQYEVERQNYAKQKAALKKRVEELQRQQQKQQKQHQHPITTTGHGLRRAHSSTGGRGSGSALGSDERHSGTSTSAVMGNGSKTSSFASDSHRMSSSTLSHNKENEKHDSVLDKIMLGDVPKSPPGGVMKATEALAGMMEEAPQMSFLHPPSDTENVSPRRSRIRGSKSDLASKIPLTVGGQQGQELSTRADIKPNSHKTLSLRSNSLAPSRSKEDATMATKDVTSGTGTTVGITGNTAGSTRVRPVTAMFRPHDNAGRRAASSSPDPWLISTSSPGIPSSLPVLPSPVLSDRINGSDADADADHDNDQRRPSSLTKPSLISETQSRRRDRRRYNTSSSSSSSSDTSSTDENRVDRNNNDDNDTSNAIDEEDPPSLHIPSPRLPHPVGRNPMEKRAGIPGGGDDSIKAASSSTLNTKSSSSSADAATNNSDPNKPPGNKSDASGKDTDKDNDNVVTNPTSHNSLRQQQQQPSPSSSSSSSSSNTNENSSANQKQESESTLKEDSKAAVTAAGAASAPSPSRTTTTPKSIPILIPPTPATTIAPQPTATATKLSTLRSGSKIKRLLSSEQKAAAKARLDMRRRYKEMGGGKV